MQHPQPKRAPDWAYEDVPPPSPPRVKRVKWRKREGSAFSESSAISTVQQPALEPGVVPPPLVPGWRLRSFSLESVDWDSGVPSREGTPRPSCGCHVS